MVGWLYYLHAQQQRLAGERAASQPAPKPAPVTPKKKPRRKKVKP